jgi:hypothetical protein
MSIIEDVAPAEETPTIGNLGQPGPEIQPLNGRWRPKSKRVGIGPIRYVWWTSFYTLMEFANRFFARNPNRRVSWDKWPPYLGLLYLIAKIRFNRSNALTDPYDYQTTDDDPASEQPAAARVAIAPDGKWVSDDRDGQMGAAMTRFSSNFAPRYVRPDIEKITPPARKVSERLRWRQLDEDGAEIVRPALILNVMAQCWIQFQFHGFGGNTLHDPINENPYRLPRRPNDGWLDGEAIIERTAKDPTRPTYDGRPTPINEKVHAWVQGQLYGNNEAELNRLRTFVDGKLALDGEGHLPEDPARPGVDLTGFNNNYSPYLSVLHWLFVKEHNAIADHLKGFHPEFSDEELFQLARRTNCAQIARIHTIEWTEDLLQHPTLQIAMHGDWYGFLGQRLKLYLIRLSHRRPAVGRWLKPLRDQDIFWGMTGSAWEHHDGPFQVPKHFRMVYRLHEMILSKNRTYDPKTGALLAEIDLLDFIHEHTRDHVRRLGYDALAWSFLSESCGSLELHNFPRSLTRFERMQDHNLIDLAELDIFREREDGTGSYNDFRRSLGEPAVESFLELTGGDAAAAKELEIVYEGDVSTVDAGIGILAEPKPKGFALGFVQFYQFVLNAPRRIKSNRFLSQGYNYAEFQEGLDWVEHAGGFKGVIRRQLPALSSKLEGVKRAFAPWPDSETFPDRLLEESQDDNSRALFGDLRTVVLLILSTWLAISLGVTLGWLFLPMVVLAIAALAVAFGRSIARRHMMNCARKAYTDKRQFMFKELYTGVDYIRWSSWAGKLWAVSVLVLCCLAVISGWSGPRSLAVCYAICVISAISAWKWSKATIATALLLKVSLRNRMREGQTRAEPEPKLSSPVQSELENLRKRYAPGRDYFTAYDFARMREAQPVNVLATRVSGRFTRLLFNHADLVVEEDRSLVPAISMGMCARVLLGLADKDVARERALPAGP